MGMEYIIIYNAKQQNTLLVHSLHHFLFFEQVAQSKDLVFLVKRGRVQPPGVYYGNSQFVVPFLQESL